MGGIDKLEAYQRLCSGTTSEFTYACFEVRNTRRVMPPTAMQAVHAFREGLRGKSTGFRRPPVFQSTATRERESPKAQRGGLHLAFGSARPS